MRIFKETEYIQSTHNSIVSSQNCYMFQPNVIIRLATGKKIKMYIQLYWGWDLKPYTHYYIKNTCTAEVDNPQNKKW